MHVRNLIAETGKVYFLRRQKLALNMLHRENNAHEFTAFTVSHIGHFPNMPLKDHPAKTRVIFVVDVHDARQRVGPHNDAAGFVAQDAATDGLGRLVHRRLMRRLAFDVSMHVTVTRARCHLC